MHKIKLYIATSLDGFIARKDGSLDWLEEIAGSAGTDYGYTEFISGISTVIMGRKSYEEILGFGVEWPYKDCRTYVVSSNQDIQLNTPSTEVLTSPDKVKIGKIRDESEKDTWLLGGGEVITEFLKLNLIDEMILSVIPVILGEGIRLFPGNPPETRLILTGTESFVSGVVNLYYKAFTTD